MDELAEDGQQCGFATAFDRGFDTKIGADVAEFEGIGVEDPKGDGLGGPLGEDDEPEQEGAEVVEEEFAGDRFGPGFAGWELERGGGG